MSFDTLILAAGRSERMGSPKALLNYEGETLLERILRIAHQTTPGKIGLVCGNVTIRGTLTQAIAEKLSLPISNNLIITEGKSDGHPIDSIRRGLKALQTNHRLLIWPVDMAFGSGELIENLAASFDATENKIARPTHGDKHGHPLLFGRQAVQELHSPLADMGAHGVVHHDPSRIIDIPWKDKRVVHPMNTPEQALQCGLVL